ncbi:PAS domain S-box protein [Phormidium sp. CLA17]|uniref:PAS domain S-box protein n=1 Tax=Leptolyngbya sp. Cla-17 TaxID=2803751 RepID=UPI001491EED9|nr:PAS domain S-box protein [Leptolyngbya sp. Cla-17]MBM0742815.1 PAS domain S-box protein [Leptolyngbya sp. Cla-17]
MENEPLSIADIAPEDWNSTPETVKQLVEALLAKVKQREVLLKHKSRLTQFLDATPIGIAVYESTGQLAYINHIGQELLGIDRHSEAQANLRPETFQVYRTSSQLLYPIEELPTTLALAGKAAQVDDLEIHRADQVVPLEVWATPILDDRGQVEYAIAAFQDITERVRSEAKRQQVEQALSASEHRYRQVVQAQSDFILRSLPDTTITFANDAMCDALGYPLEQVTGQKWCDFAHADELPTILQKIAALTPHNPRFFAENRDRRANDQVGWTQWLNEGIFNDQGHLVELQSVGRDITALKQAEAARRKSEERYRQVVETMLEGIWIIDVASRTTYANPRMAEMLGYTADEMIGKDLFHFMDESGQAISNQNLERRRQGIKEQHDFRFKTKTGQDLWALLSTNPLYDDVGNYIGALATVTDITQRKQAQTALEESEQRFRNLFESIPKIAVQGYNRHRQVIYWNDASEKLYGYSKTEALGQQLEDLIIPPEMRQALIAEVERCITEKQPIPAGELSLMHQDGSRVTVYSSHTMLVNPSGEMEMYCVDIDLSDRKRAEALLYQSEQALRQRIDQEQALSRVVKAIRQSLELDDIFTTATVEIAHLLQADRSAVVQYLSERQCWKHVSEYRHSSEISNTLGTEIPDQGNPLADQLKQFKVVRIDNPVTLEDEINQEFAKTFPGSWLLVPLIVDQKLWGSFSMVRLQSTSPWTEEEANLVQTIGDQLAIAIQQAQAFERAQTEITQRQQAEAYLRAALAEKEVLLKEIHHRVKNNLQIVSGLLQLQAHSLQDSPAINALRESQNRVESMSLIHKKIYIASDLEQIDAADYIQSLATSLLTTYKVSLGAIALQVDVEPVILSVDQGIPCGLIINELVSNALKYAFPENQPGEIRIQLRQVGHELELIIQDNGIGIPDHLDLSTINSLGLSLVHALSTEQLEGSLAVDRSQGTMFTIKFPRLHHENRLHHESRG